jgi:hypothetical protein
MMRFLFWDETQSPVSIDVRYCSYELISRSAHCRASHPRACIDRLTVGFLPSVSLEKVDARAFERYKNYAGYSHAEHIKLSKDIYT